MNDWIFGVTGVGPLLDQLHDHLPGTDGVVLLSGDGILLAASAATRADRADQLSAVAAGLHAIARAADSLNGGGRVDQTVVEMDYRMLVIVPVTGEMLLAVVFDAVNDLSGTRQRIAAFADHLGVRLARVDISPAEPELLPIS
ncbi:roadblock/LC7 domain-containing protein [Paractinoplanes globisporus]|uniref:Roadblock/LC7 domain-containing protein n=1 Tax=Paractinoplanes globisporus TaxID=113565 RepID=A0ABW6WF84_9ACTN|nr:roadblock/LC7 domain-containing protein [Actinoplanes globisporus]